MTGVLEEKFAKDLVGIIQDPVMVLDRQGIILNMNSAVGNLFGYGKKEATGKHFLELSYEHATLPKELVRVKRDFNAAVKTSASITFEYEYITKKGKSVHVSFSGSLLKNSKQKTISVIAIFSNITERKKTDWTLRKRVKELACLLATSELASKPELSINAFLEGVVQLIPPTWNYPKITCARIVLGAEEFTTSNFRETQWKQAVNIKVNKELKGAIEVYYLEERPDIDEGPFLREERNLSNSLAKQIEHMAELRKAEEATEEQREWLSGTLSSIGDAVIATDTEAKVTLMNAVAEELTGWNSQEAMGQTIHEVFHIINEHTRELAENPVDKVLTEGITVGLANHTLLISRDGREIPIDDSGAPIQVNGDRTLGVVLVFRDITERKKAEEVVQIQNQIADVFLTVLEEEMYNEVLNIFIEALDSKFGVFGFLDEEGALVVPSMTRHIWDECQVADKTIVFPRDTWGKSTWPRCVQEKRVIHMNEPSTITPEGHITVERHISMPIIHRDEVIGLFQVANKDTDYTEEDIRILEEIARYVAPILHARLRKEWSERERKKADEELRILYEELEERVEERTTQLRETQEKLVTQERLATLGKLSGGIGHELRNPLGAIKNAIFYLRMDIENPDEDMAATLDALDKEVGSCERIISSLLGYARPRAPTLQKTALDDVIGDSLSRLKVPVNVNIVQKYPDEQQLILADPDQMVQVCVNLILNAIQAMPDGGTLTIAVESHSYDWIELSITDTGVGITNENLNQLFEPLFTTKAKGIGLGLAIIKTMIEGHGGRIDVQSEVGRGSTFTVYLPTKMTTQT